MIKIDIKKIICLILVTVFLLSTNAVAFQEKDEIIETSVYGSEDIDPLVDLEVTVTIKEIRALDKIDLFGDPDFYVKVFINDVEHTSPIWRNQKYVKPIWSVTQDVPDDEENVYIKIQLWDQNFLRDKICDISQSDQSDPNSYDVELIYSLKTGHWRGDDYVRSDPLFSDLSGYGRLNGCDDNSIYQNDRDCELWFNITQTDYDGDGIPYWTEVNVYKTSPVLNDAGMDYDGDGVPIEWEYNWGHYFRYNHSLGEFEHRWIYHPFVWEDHANLDPDVDGLDNIEEYLTSQWGSDPFRRDLFIELDQMDEGPNGEPKSLLPEKSKELLRDAYDRQNIVYHLDDGCMGGGEMIPFDAEGDNTTREEFQGIYWNYFLHGDINNWRRGVFHYGLIVYKATWSGFVFSGGVGPYLDSFQISRWWMERKINKNPIIFRRNSAYASCFMHETGHTLGIFASNNPGCDNWESVRLIGWLKWRSYKSCMSYNYVFMLVDYSDGSHGKNDFDDWSNLDLTFFQREIEWR